MKSAKRYLWHAVLCIFAIFPLSVSVYFSTAVFAEEAFPSRPITIVNPIVAGGPTDVVLRLLADRAGKMLGQPVVVVNNAGGGDIIAVSEVQQAKADGYTLLYLTPACAFIVPQVEKAPFDPLRDFKPILQYGEMNWGVIVNDGAPYKGWKDLVEAGKARRLRYVTGAPTSLQAVVLNAMAKKEGISLVNIPYRGAAEYQAALMGGHGDFAAGDFSYSLVEAKKLKPILMLSKTRSPMYPNVPSMKELGFDFPVPVPFILVAPSKTAEPIMKKLEAAFTEAAKHPDYIKGVAEVRLLTTFRSSSDAARYIQTTYKEVGEMLKEAGLKN